MFVQGHDRIVIFLYAHMHHAKMYHSAQGSRALFLEQILAKLRDMLSKGYAHWELRESRISRIFVRINIKEYEYIA